MAKDFAISFYRSTAWRKCREAYIVSVNGLCEVCLVRGDYVPGYIVHHKIVLKPSNINDPEVTLNHDCLQHVCLDCHNTLHHGSNEVTRDGLVFTITGDIIKVG